MDDTNSFREDLKQLMRLFKQLQAKMKREGSGMIDKSYLKNMDMFINSVNLEDESISDEIIDQLEQFGQPVRDMIRQTISQLKAELGDDLDTLDSVPLKEIKLDNKIEVGPTLEEIDRMLQLPDLPVEEMNRLLDQRSKFKK